MKNRLIILAVCAFLAIPAIGSATPPRPGPYVSGFLGMAMPVDTDATSTQFTPVARTFNDRIAFDNGVNLGGSGGFDFGFFRMEGEISYKNGEMSSITEQIDQIRFANVDGRVGAYALMFNAFVDLRNPSPVTPYFGGGVGFATLHLSDTFGTDTRTGTRLRLYESDNDSVFAYQVGGGVEIALTTMFSLDIGYRYFNTAKARFNRNGIIPTELKFESHNASVGFRVKF